MRAFSRAQIKKSVLYVLVSAFGALVCYALILQPRFNSLQGYFDKLRPGMRYSEVAKTVPTRLIVVEFEMSPDIPASAFVTSARVQSCCFHVTCASGRNVFWFLESQETGELYFDQKGCLVGIYFGASGTGWEPSWGVHKDGRPRLGGTGAKGLLVRALIRFVDRVFWW